MTDEAKRIAEALHNGAEYNYCNSCMVGELDDCHDKTSCVLLKAVDLIEELSDELEQVKKKLKEALDDLEMMGEYRPFCESCIYNNIDARDEPCKSCCQGYIVNNWYWRGLSDRL